MRSFHRPCRRSAGCRFLFYIVKNLIEFGSHWIHIIPGLFMNFFNTDALSGACAGSLLEKIPYAEEKKSGEWDSISRPLPH